MTKSEEETPRILLVCGGDLLETFSVPGLWQDTDVSSLEPTKSLRNLCNQFQILTIVRDYGLVVISREGSDPEKYVYHHDVLHRFRVSSLICH